MSSIALDTILRTFSEVNITLCGFVHALLASQDAAHQSHIQEAIRDIPIILDILVTLPATCQSTQAWACRNATDIYSSELKQLVKCANGFHFHASHAHATQIEAFSIPEMAVRMQQLAPGLWELLQDLMALNVDPLGRDRRVPLEDLSEDDAVVNNPAVEDDDSDALYWPDDSDKEGGEGDIEGEVDQEVRVRASKRRRKAAQRRKSLLQIRTVGCLSTCMISVNQWCNLLPSINGFFCHASGAPETVIDMMAHAGTSISTTSINNIVTSLSTESRHRVRELGQSLCAAWGFDNIGWQQKPAEPTLENQGVHIEATMAMFQRLEHGVTSQDLRCSRALWAQNPLNPHALTPSFKPTFHHLVLISKNLQAEGDIAESTPTRSLTRRTRLWAWHIRNILIEHGEDFEDFKGRLGQPEVIFQIPVKKTIYIPGRAMHINKGTHDGAGAVFDNLLRQAGLGDPSESDFDSRQLQDMSEYVIPTHLDLGSIEKYQGIFGSRVIEENPKRRIQYPIPMMGLFHLEMAAEEALNRTYIQPMAAREDVHSTFEHVGILHPKEAGQFISAKGPGFRQMHTFIHYDAAACLLDCWRIQAQRRNPAHNTLKAFAASKPDWECIVEISERIALENVAGRHFGRSRHKPEGERDKVFENTLLKNRDFLLYIELHHAINHGDIGRVEATFVDWSMIFKAAGKHKYAAHVVQMLMNLHHIYPQQLCRAIRLNWLCNPQGKPDTFRAVDWLIELNNLYIKIIFSGSGPNRSIDYIIKQSPLIELYRACHTVIKNNYFITARSRRHAPVNMRRTLRKLLEHIQTQDPHVYKSGRTTKYSIPDQLYVGANLLQQQDNLTSDASAEDEPILEERALEADDFNV